MYDNLKICNSFVPDSEIIPNKFNENELPIYKNDWVNKMSILFSASCKDGIVLACDSKIFCSKENQYVAKGFHYSDEKCWYEDSLAAVCCGNLDFVDYTGYTGWKDLLEDAVSESNYLKTKDFIRLRDSLESKIRPNEQTDTTIILADATKRKVLCVNGYKAIIHNVDDELPCYAESFAYAPVNLKAFYANFIRDVNNYTLAELEKLAANYITINIQVGDFIANISKKESPIGGEVHILSLQNDGFIKSYTI